MRNAEGFGQGVGLEEQEHMMHKKGVKNNFEKYYFIEYVSNVQLHYYVNNYTLANAM